MDREDDRLKVTWLGQSAFLIEGNDRLIEVRILKPGESVEL